jgi:hypothetical protein
MTAVKNVQPFRKRRYPVLEQRTVVFKVTLLLYMSFFFLSSISRILYGMPALSIIYAFPPTHQHLHVHRHCLLRSASGLT